MRWFWKQVALLLITSVLLFGALWLVLNQPLDWADVTNRGHAGDQLWAHIALAVGMAAMLRLATWFGYAIGGGNVMLPLILTIGSLAMVVVAVDGGIMLMSTGTEWYHIVFVGVGVAVIGVLAWLIELATDKRRNQARHRVIPEQHYPDSL